MARTARAPLLSLLCTLALAGTAAAQQVLTQPEQVITIAKGRSALVLQRVPVERVSVADDKIAEPVPVSPSEFLINAKQIGTTSLVVWSRAGGVTLYSVEVTADAEFVRRQIALLGPDAKVDVTASGNTIILSGTVARPTQVRRALEIARASGATIVNNIRGPSAAQVLLKVRFAEVSHTALQSFGVQLGALNLERLRPGGPVLDSVSTISDGIVNLFLASDNAAVSALINALRRKGEFRSLAEPSLLALDGDTASFLAGGEFPFPIVQGGAGNNAVSIQWREFGVRLRFQPFITDVGGIRLHLAPEVSSLDFANGLVFQGFRIPTITERRAETTVELREGQSLAIAGLLDNSTLRNATKIPLLGDLPILGALFRSSTTDQTRNELLVVITPQIIQPSDVPLPVPTGEPDTWKWLRGVRPKDLHPGNPGKP